MDYKSAKDFGNIRKFRTSYKISQKKIISGAEEK